LLIPTKVDVLIPRKKFSFKICLTGDPAVGKTSLRKSFLGEIFSEKYLSTVGVDFSIKKITTDNAYINLTIWDLAGQTEFSGVQPKYYLFSRGAIAVFDITDKQSFLNVKPWVERFLEHSQNPSAPVLIIGNKIDLISPELTDYITENQQQELVQELQKDFPDVPFLMTRTSAKTGEKVERSFQELIDKILSKVDGKKSDLQKPVQGNMDIYVPAAYTLWLDEKYGPQIFSRSPSLGDTSSEEILSTVKVMSIIDFDEIVSSAYISGSLPWKSPSGTFYYRAFPVKNPKARGGANLFILGVVIQRRLESVINMNYISGYLSNTMNSFANYLREKNLPPTSLTSDDKEKISRKILYSLRQNIFDMICENMNL
jgi:Ras-related protein Rab-1A